MGCVMDKSEYKKKWYLENIEITKERAKKRYEEKKDEILLQLKQYREENKEQVKATKKMWALNNKDKVKSYIKKCRDKNQDNYSATAKKWRLANKEKHLEQIKTWSLNNKDKINSYNVKRRSDKLNATPSWFNELDEFVIKEAFDLCKKREISTGIKWHVDHMIPLNAKEACGLHCRDNIQVIPQRLNNIKINKMLFTNTFEWITRL